MKKVLSVGEATMDCFTFLKDAEVHCTLDKGSCELCLRYADKILPEKVVFSGGGNGANTAVSFSRLGLHSFLYSVIGDDNIGKQLIASLNDEKIDPKYIQVVKGPTSYTTAIVFQNERTLLVYHQPWEYHLPEFEPVDWVYLTSMGKNYKTAYDKTLQYIKKTGAKMSFNPGSFQLKAGLATLKPYFAATDVLFLNREEAMLLTEQRPSASFRDLAEALYDMGPKVINITDGPKGAYCFDGHTLLFLDILPVEIVERTGTGDSYAAGFTAALLHGKPLEEAMRWGMANSAGVVGQIGPQAGLLTTDKMAELLNDHHHITAKVVEGRSAPAAKA